MSFAVFAIAGAAYIGIDAASAKGDASLLMQNVEAVAENENQGITEGGIGFFAGHFLANN